MESRFAVEIDLRRPLPGVGWGPPEDCSPYGTVRRIERSRVATLHLALPNNHAVHVRVGVAPAPGTGADPIGLRANAQDIELQHRRGGDGSLTIAGTIPQAGLASGKRLTEIAIRSGAQGTGVHAVTIHEARSEPPWQRVFPSGGLDCGCVSPTAHDVLPTVGPFLIILARPAAGLFSLFTHVLRCLVSTPELIPVVYYGKGAYRYWSDEGWEGSLNGWEYYFHPLSDYALHELLHEEPEALAELSGRDIERRFESSSIIVTNWWKKFAYSWRLNDALLAERNARSFRELFGRVVAERIRVKDHVLAEVNEFWDRHLAGGRVIGLHYRSTDKPAERAKHNRSMLPNIDECLDRAVAAPGSADATFFLATEDALAVERARERLGNRLVSIDATRSRDDVPPHFAVGGPRVGQEALLDCLLLSRCDYLVHGASNLSEAAMLFNPRLAHIDVSRPVAKATKNPG